MHRKELQTINKLTKERGLKMRKTKKQRAAVAWRRVYQDVINTGDLNRFLHQFNVYDKMYSCPAYLWWNLRYEIYHSVVLLKWKASTNITHRNNLLNTVRIVLGEGLANELQFTSRTRTWK